jgi:hypothetical protein
MAHPPLLIATTGDFQELAQFDWTKLPLIVGNPSVFHSFDQTKHARQKTAAVAFFRISTSTFKLAFSRRNRFSSACKTATLPATGLGGGWTFFEELLLALSTQPMAQRALLEYSGGGWFKHPPLLALI